MLEILPYLAGVATLIFGIVFYLGLRKLKDQVEPHPYEEHGLV